MRIGTNSHDVIIEHFYDEHINKLCLDLNQACTISIVDLSALHGAGYFCIYINKDKYKNKALHLNFIKIKSMKK